MPSKMKTCEDYRTALTDAAAAAGEPSLELLTHLDACASCSAAFNQEQQLFAAMDDGLRTAANAEVPGSLLPRVRAQLNERPTARPAWVPAFAASAAVAALIVAIVLFRGFGGRDVAVPNPQASSVAHNVQLAEIKPAPPAAVPFEKTGPAGKNKAVRTVKIAPAVRAEVVAVLVPAGQKHTIDAFLASIQRGKVDGVILAAEKPEKALQELQVSPLEFSPIEVKPLADVSAESPSQNEKTSR